MIPRATYRLQLHHGFTFDAAAAVVPYLAALGVSHIYASPILKARAGSTHCYDVVDPTIVNPELGGADGLRRLVATLRRAGMGLIADIVPNHMGVGGHENPYWLDVLRQGPTSPYADMFDIDWPAGGGRLLAPFLGVPYGEALERGDIRLGRDDRLGWAVRYFTHAFPLRPQDAQVLDADPGAAAQLSAGDLHALLERQHFRLAFWRTAPDLINWRRFFDVTELAALRAGAPGVFERTHDTVLGLYAEGLLDGLRVDHVDGLADPGAYCRRLRGELSAREAGRPEGLRGRAWLVVEKILATGEPLDPSWEVDGTTGYDFMEETSRLLHDASGRDRLAADWAARTGCPAAFAPEEHAARREIIPRAFTATLEGAVDALMRLAARALADRDRSRAALRRCLVEILVHFPRYRAYAAGEGKTGQDALRQAVEAARRTSLPGDLWHLDRIADWLGPPAPDAGDTDLRHDAIRRFEQLSAPVAAKAVEDTAFYRYGPLLSRNEVGSDPAVGGGTVEDWHRTTTERARSWPAAMLASATHDHKRGEDVRARLSVLAECPQLWLSHLDRWLAVLADRAPRVETADRIMLLQTLVGAWPDRREELSSFSKRVQGWQVKALREAKRVTSWDGPDEAYEAEARGLTQFLLQSAESGRLSQEMSDFVDVITPAARAKSLIQTVLKLTAPGIPDLYQGTEYQDFSLVDPDNRQPVDFVQRERSLHLPPQSADARKQHLIRALLGLRSAEPDLFQGGYLPLDTACPLPVVAFARTSGTRALLVICPVRTFQWIDTDGRLLPGAWEGLQVKLPVPYQWRPLLAEDDAPITAAGQLAPPKTWPFALLVGHVR